MEVSLGPVPELPGASEIYGHLVHGSQVLLRFPEIGSFFVREGASIVATPVDDLEERVTRLFTLGPAMAVLLHQRGSLVLHASSVAIGDGGVAFLGDSEWGKSTTAAAFMLAGHDLVADDITAVSIHEGRAAVVPAFPQIKLWPESARTLGLDPDQLPLIHPDLDKVALRRAESFAHDPLPVSAVFVLGPGDSPEATPLAPAEAVVELIRHTHVVDLLRATGTESAHLRQCASLAEGVPMFRLAVPPDWSDVGAVIEVVRSAL